MDDIKALLVEEAHAHAAAHPGTRVHIVDGWPVTSFPGENVPDGLAEEFVRDVQARLSQAEDL